MTPKQLQAMKLALNALKQIDEAMPFPVAKLAQKAIKEALAQPERHELQAKGEHPAPCARFCEANAFKIIIKNLKAQLAQPEQEPVAIKRIKEWIEYLKRKSDFGQHMKIPSEMSAGTCWELAIELEQFINTTLPQRKPLTDEEISEIAINNPPMVHEFARAIEAAHGIKENT